MGIIGILPVEHDRPEMVRLADEPEPRDPGEVIHLEALNSGRGLEDCHFEW